MKYSFKGLAIKNNGHKGRYVINKSDGIIFKFESLDPLGKIQPEHFIVLLIRTFDDY